MSDDFDANESFEEYFMSIAKKTFLHMGKAVGYLATSYNNLGESLSLNRLWPKVKRGINIRYLVKTEATEEDAGEINEFYLNLGRDIIKLTRFDIESENLTIIKTS